MSKTKNNKLLFVRILLLLGTCCSVLANAASLQDIQQLRTLSYSVINHVLVFHNPGGSPYDPDNADGYQHAMQDLLQLSQRLDLPEVTAQAQLLSTSLEDLRNLPQSVTDTRTSLPSYSLWLPQVIEQQSQLASLLSELYSRQASANANPLQQQLHSLSWDIERISLSYQLSAFTYLVAQAWILDEQTTIELDASIQKRLAALPAQDARLAAPLQKLPSHYHYVRRYLLNPDAGWKPGAVNRYLLGTALALDIAAQQLGQ